MKYNLFAALFMLSVILLTTGCHQTSAPPTKQSASATMEELGQMNRGFAKALTAKDAEAAANMYDENASILPPNEPIVSGRANIKAYWQGAIDAGVFDASVKTIDAKSEGDLGYEIGIFTMRSLSEQGDTIVETGKFTEILKRNAAGNWISTYGMWSTNEPDTK